MKTKTIPTITPRRNLAIIKTRHTGEGLVTIDKIERGGYIGQYWGNRYPVSQRHRIKNSGANFYSFDLTNGQVIDGNNKGNLFRKMNHSCESNVSVCEMNDPYGVLGIHFFAARMIKPGEELTIDYRFATDDHTPENLAKLRCLCGSSLCRGTMLDLSGLKKTNGL